jgi:hypothetical protein
LTQLRWSRQNHRRCWTSSQNMTSRTHLQNDRSICNCAHAQTGTTLRVMVANRRKISFLLEGGTSPWNYGWLFVFSQFSKPCVVFSASVPEIMDGSLYSLSLANRVLCLVPQSRKLWMALCILTV